MVPEWTVNAGFLPRPLSTPTVRLKRLYLPLKGRSILAFLRAFVGGSGPANLSCRGIRGFGKGSVGGDGRFHRWKGTFESVCWLLAAGGRSSRFRNDVSNLFPRLHHEMRGASSDARGSGCIAPFTSPRSDGPHVAWRGPSADISTLFGRRRSDATSSSGCRG